MAAVANALDKCKKLGRSNPADIYEEIQAQAVRLKLRKPAKKTVKGWLAAWNKRLTDEQREEIRAKSLGL